MSSSCWSVIPCPWERRTHLRRRRHDVIGIPDHPGCTSGTYIHTYLIIRTLTVYKTSSKYPCSTRRGPSRADPSNGSKSSNQLTSRPNHVRSIPGRDVACRLLRARHQLFGTFPWETSWGKVMSDRNDDRRDSPGLRTSRFRLPVRSQLFFLCYKNTYWHRGLFRNMRRTNK